jgi:hypothetical protein
MRELFGSCRKLAALLQETFQGLENLLLGCGTLSNRFELLPQAAGNFQHSLMPCCRLHGIFQKYVAVNSNWWINFSKVPNFGKGLQFFPEEKK